MSVGDISKEILGSARYNVLYEMCGLCWILERLDSLKERCGPISAVRLLRYQEQDDHAIVERVSWGEVADEEWNGFLPLERPVTPIQRRVCANHWRDLAGENAPLRAVLNGRLASAPEDLYDSFIRRELDRMEDEFNGARLVCGVIGHHQLGESSLERKKYGRKAGSHMVLTAEEQDSIRKAVEEKILEDFGITGKLWTLGRTRQYIQKQFHKAINERTLSDYMKRWGMSCQHLAKRARKQNPTGI